MNRVMVVLETGPGFSQKPSIFDLWYTAGKSRLLKNFWVLKGSSGPELTPAAARARSFYSWIPGCCRPFETQLHSGVMS